MKPPYLDRTGHFLIVMLLTVISQRPPWVAAADIQFCGGQAACHGKNSRVKNIRILQQSGARPRWSPDGQTLVFDRKNANGYYSLCLMDRDGQNVHSLTEGKNGLVPQRHNGNGIFHPSGKWIVFVAEEQHHFLESMKWMSEPGLGTFCNLWATDPAGKQFVVLTYEGENITEKRKTSGWGKKKQIVSTVNPVFSKDGHLLVWTERYAKGEDTWGLWRLKAADFIIRDGKPSLDNIRVLYTPNQGNYVTAMGFLDEKRLVVAGNLEGQTEYGMDEYVLDIPSGKWLNLTKTPEYWEEGATVAPDGHVVYMSNIESHFKFNPKDKNWGKQPMERDYYMTDATGGQTERLTYFNEPTAPEYIGKRILAVALSASPDGRFLASTLGIDNGTGSSRVDMELEIALIELNPPLR